MQDEGRHKRTNILNFCDSRKPGFMRSEKNKIVSFYNQRAMQEGSSLKANNSSHFSGSVYFMTFVLLF